MSRNITIDEKGNEYERVDMELAEEFIDPYDNVNNPKHYTAGNIECIEAIKAALTEEEFRGFCKGNVLKYTWRERHKGGDESLSKAKWYLEQLINA